MSHPFPLARFVFGMCIAFFGSELLLHGHFIAGLPPAPSWTPAPLFLAYLLGISMLLLGAGIATSYRAAHATLTVAVVFLLCVLFLFLPHLSGIMKDGNIRTGAFEALSVSGAAFVLANRLFSGSLDTNVALLQRIDVTGRVLFAFSMLVFGEQHFEYVKYVAPLIPAWLPLHVFLTYFTGVCFVASALAIGFNVFRPLAATLLGAMFLSWVLVVHLPRLFRMPHKNDEWVSAVIALTLAAGSFAIASPPEASHRQI